MHSAGGENRGRWSAAIALSIAVLFLPALPSLPLVVLSFLVLLLALPPRSFRALALAVAVLAWVFFLVPAGGAWSLVGYGWALLVGGLFTIIVVVRPAWSFLSQALTAVGAAALGTGIWLGASGAWGQVNWLMGEQFRSAALLVSGVVAAQMPEAPWVPEFVSAMAQYAEWQQQVFPALLALQTLAALGLAWWMFVRLTARDGRWRTLHPLRDFRFNDQLVWLVIIGLALILLPLDTAAARLGTNALLFMGALYALRGVAVFIFLAGKDASRLSMALGALAAVFLYPLVLTAALLIGLGDTWLDVRGRVAQAARN